MLALFALVAPLFLLMFIGYAARFTGLCNETSTKGLSDFFVNFATPALLYKLIIYTVLPEGLPIGYVISYFSGAFITWGALAYLVLKPLKGTWGQSVIAGLSTGQANTVMIGIPLLISVYGEEAAHPIAFLIAFNTPLMLTIATLLLEGGNANKNAAAIAKHLVKSIFTHPILIAIMLGFLSKLIGFKPFEAMKTVLDYLAAAAVPAALVALGMALYEYGLKGNYKILSLAVVAKLFFHPLLTFIFAHYIFKLPPLWVGSAVIFAAMPIGINTFMFAKKYGEGEEFAASGIAVSTVLSLFTIVAWLAILPR